MRILLTIALLSNFSIFLIGQSLVVDTIKDEKNFIYVDSVYVNKGIKIRTEYRYNWIQNENKTWTLYNQEKYLASRGYQKLFGDSWRRIGIWSYWYKNEQKQKEVKYAKNGTIRYINQWLKSGESLLSNGLGIYYEHSYSYAYPDSIVFEIKDSLKHGAYWIWRPSSKDKEYYLFKIGTYEKNVESDYHTQFYEGGSLKLFYQKNDSTSFNIWQEFHKNGNLAAFGFYGKYNKIGEWKYWHINGRLKQECQYKNGRFIGEFKEYYDNGIIKSTGCYMHIEGQDTISSTDPITGELNEVIIDSNEIPVKNGIWNYYDSNGNLIKTETYKLGRIH